jgi:hypothetical protein
LKTFFYFLISIYSCTIYDEPIFAQSKIDLTHSLSQIIALNGSEYSYPTLYAHFDKTVYSNDDNVWFTAYLLNYNKKVDTPSVVSVLLIDDSNRKIVLNNKFAMSNGFSFGNFFLPDSIPSGDFTFVMFTNQNVNGIPVDAFRQPVTIKRNSDLNIKLSLKLLDYNDDSPGPFRKIETKVFLQNGQLAFGASLSFYMGFKLLKTALTDKNGTYVLFVPADELKQNNTLVAIATIKKSSNSLRMTLPISEGKLRLKFYPEGGNLVNMTRSVVSWETKDGAGNPIKVKGVLFKDGKPVDTIETDSYGMGRFRIIPVSNSNYKVKVLGSAKDTLYELPEVAKKGLVLSVNRSITNDSLLLRLFDNDQGKYYVVIHNQKQLFYCFQAEANSLGKLAIVYLNKIPKGLTSITVLDSLQRPCAERMFFAHYDQRTKVEIATNKADYSRRERVQLKLKLNAVGVDTLKGLVSVACVQSNRIALRQSNDIESYFYLKHDLGKMPLKENYMGRSVADVEYLEKLLLIKGWQRYTWMDMEEKAKSTGLRQQSTFATFNGNVYKNGKELKKKVNLLIKSDSITNIVTTSQKGSFILNRNNLLTAEGKKVYLILNDISGYSISVDDPFEKMNAAISSKFTAQNFMLPVTGELNSDSNAVNGLEHTVSLKEVSVKARKDDNFINDRFDQFNETMNKCGDYVCIYNVLNCPNHRGAPDNRPAVIGEVYYIGKGKSLYTGCKVLPEDNKSVISINGITYSKEFYVSDYSLFNPPSPEYLSTIYWKHFIVLNSKGETTLTFYTSDITGPFKVIIQGVTQNDVIYAEKEISVRQ